MPRLAALDPAASLHRRKEALVAVARPARERLAYFLHRFREVLGRKTVNDLSQQAGTPRDDLLSQLARYLPAVIDKLTPNGQLPNPADLRSDYRRN